MTNAQHTRGPLVTTKIDCESGWVDILATDGRHDDLPVGSTRHGAAEANARLLVAAFNSYDKHFGPNAIAAAEADLLGKALALVDDLAALIEAEFGWADEEPTENCINGVSMCSTCQGVGCLTDKLTRARALLTKAGKDGQ